MLRFKSFKITDSEGINTFMDTCRLAAGAHVFVSDGHLLIPYEDGEPKSAVHRIIDIKEQKNTILAQVDIINHSQAVLDLLRKDSQNRINEAEANLAEARTKKGKEHYDAIKAAEERLKIEKGALTQLENQYNQNTVELTRLHLNIDLFDKQIERLGS